jgi:hypothetical protein
MTLKFTDLATLSATRKTQDGYLVTEAFAVRSGVQVYNGSEVGMLDLATVRVYRPESEVRSPASLQTFSHAPITMGHPAEPVTKDNWKDLAKGEVSTEASWEDGKIKLPLILKDADAINSVNDGTRQLSAGYTAVLELSDGVSPQGEAYDAIQREIRINHLALVPRGRAGDEFRIEDGAVHWGVKPCPPTSSQKDNAMTLINVVLGDRAVQVAVADGPAVELFKTNAAKALADADTAHAAVIVTKDEEIGTLKADNKKLTDAAMTPAKMTTMVADRVALETSIKAVAPKLECANVSDADLRKGAVAEVYGDDMVKDSSEAEISGMFKALLRDSAERIDSFADAMKNKKPYKASDADPWADFAPTKEA